MRRNVFLSQFISSLRCSAASLIAAVAMGCSTPPEVAPPAINLHRKAEAPDRIAVLPSAPSISEVRHLLADDGSHRVEVLGSDLRDGAVAEIYNEVGGLLGSVALAGDGTRRTATLPPNMARVGEYKITVSNPDSRYSNMARLSIVEPQPEIVPPTPSPCDSDLSGSASTVYLGGGDAEKMFERYLAQSSDVAGKIPYRVKIKFYQQEAADLVLQTVSLGEFEDLFLESRNDFFEKMKKRLRGKTAVFNPSLKDEAARENAHYLQCR
ncbi:MAG: hypothetical protein ACK5HO_12205 [Pseudomonadota bacterium]|jgi:hypothetical protein